MLKLYIARRSPIVKDFIGDVHYSFNTFNRMNSVRTHFVVYLLLQWNLVLHSLVQLEFKRVKRKKTKEKGMECIWRRMFVMCVCMCVDDVNNEWDHTPNEHKAHKKEYMSIDARTKPYIYI